MSRLKITIKDTRDRTPRKIPGQGSTLGSVFGDAFARVERESGEHMQTEEFWREVWKDA